MRIGISGIAGPTGCVGTELFVLPEEWVRFMVEHIIRTPLERRDEGETVLVHLISAQLISAEYRCKFTKFDATLICEWYLNHQKKEEWPVLLGMSPVMDEALGLRLKRGDGSWNCS